MEALAKIIGVHPVEATEPVYLIELIVKDPNGFDWMNVTQEKVGQQPTNWQVAYDEQILKNSEHGAHFVFFFHYLDFSKSLLTSFGPLEIPKATPIPTHLRGILYYPPD